jgi:NAD+ kinase
MKISITKALVFYKKSPYHLLAEERKNPRILGLIEKKDETVEKMLRNHREHEATMEEVRQGLLEAGVIFDFVCKDDVKAIDGYDFVFTVGGDGTFLDASHLVSGICMMGINSSPKDSVGLFCCAQRSNFRWKLRQLFAGELESVVVFRMNALIDGVKVREPILNDTLFCNLVPAATTKYFLEVRGKVEEHKSSGVWVSTAAGSTAAIRSAGGRTLPIGSRRIQYLVRELFSEPSKRQTLVGGVLGPEDTLVIRSKMLDGRIFIDGPTITYPVSTGSTVEFAGGRDPLQIVGFTEYRRGL